MSFERVAWWIVIPSPTCFGVSTLHLEIACTISCAILRESTRVLSSISTSLCSPVSRTLSSMKRLSGTSLDALSALMGVQSLFEGEAWMLDLIQSVV